MGGVCECVCEREREREREREKFGQKVLSFIQILDLSHTSRFCIGLTGTEIKIKIWISFSDFMSSSLWQKQKCSAVAILFSKA